jgi:DNA helicase HerA-like ATPase
VFGLNEYLYRQKHIHQPIVINTQELINGHLLLAGMSGTGKSYQAQRLLTNAIKQNLEVDIFDVHNELDQSETDSALYSESTQLGFNLLSVSPDPHSGGVRRRITEIINMVNATSRKLGFKQETALRNLLNDVYRINGCNAYEANTWRKKEITGAIRNNLIEQRDYQGLRQYYPVMDDLLSFAERKLTSLYLGTNIKAVLALEEVNHLAKQLNRARQKHDKSTQDAQTEKVLDIAKSKVKAAFEAYVDHIESGNEISDVMKYNSKEVLQSVLERLNILNAAGIFHPNPPAFGDANGRCHQIKHLSDDEQSMFVSMRLESIFRQCRDSGVKSDIQHIVFVDEAHKFISEDSDNIINIIAKEGRKFGLGLWCASQSPTHFSEDFLTNCGTTILLGLHSSYWDMACRKLRIEPSVLKFIRPQQVAAIKLQLKGSMDSKFQNVIINETTLASVV